jgi:hypothetical protein
MMKIERGAKRTAKPNIFISHSSRDKAAALTLASTLNFCAIDVWLDDWELEVGQSLTDELAKAMIDSRFIAILITENYNKTVWTKAEYKKALAREQSEQRIVMLPLVVGEAQILTFLRTRSTSICERNISQALRSSLAWCIIYQDFASPELSKLMHPRVWPRFGSCSGSLVLSPTSYSVMTISKKCCSMGACY